MVVAVHDVDKFAYPGALADEVEREAVHQVLEKGPKEHGAGKNGDGHTPAETRPVVAIIKHEGDDGDVHTPYDEGVGFGKHLQVLILEKTSLPFVMDLVKLHSGQL